MIVRRPITRFRSNTLRAAMMCLVAGYPAVAANPPAKPLIISIAPIRPQEGNGEHLAGLDNGVDDLKTALYNAWQRRTDKELDIEIPDEEVSLAVKEISKMTKPTTQVAAKYIVRTKYLKVGNRTKAIAALWRPEMLAAATAVSDEHMDPDSLTPFTVLGERLADALAKTEGIKVTTYMVGFCRFAFQGRPQASEGMQEDLRVMIVQSFGKAPLMPVLSAAPSDCGQQPSGSGARVAGGTETISVSGIVYFLPAKIVISVVVGGEVIAEHECVQEQDLQQKETINSLIPDFWSRLDEQIRRHRRGG